MNAAVAERCDCCHQVMRRIGAIGFVVVGRVTTPYVVCGRCAAKIKGATGEHQKKLLQAIELSVLPAAGGA